MAWGKSTIRSMGKLVVVTGATGYIGGAICIDLKKHGHTVVGIDWVKRPYLKRYMDDFIWNDFKDVLPLINADAVIHCAGTSLVGPSIADPYDYYENNVSKSLKLIRHCAQNNIELIFSSSASVYGTCSEKLTENLPLRPESPYAQSKAMVEKMAADFVTAHNLKFTSLRYFNACGAVDDIHGQRPGATHIFAKIFEAYRSESAFCVYGNDYDTPDGTCIRDYVHVKDIARVHVKAVENPCPGTYNVGLGVGFSNLGCVKAVSDFYGKNIAVEFSDRRKGDTDRLVASNNKVRAFLDWVPKYNLNDVVSSLDIWYNSKTYSGLRVQPAL